MMICGICNKKIGSATSEILFDGERQSREYICSLCRFLFFGEKSDEDRDYSFETKDGIVLWIKDGIIVDAWIDSGETAIPDSVYQRKKVWEVIQTIRKVMGRGELWCTDCSRIISEKDVKKSEFAARYCEECSK